MMFFNNDRVTIEFEKPKFKRDFVNFQLIEVGFGYDDDQYGICKHKETYGLTIVLLGFGFHFMVHVGDEVKETNDDK